jgi:hypothetical protein
MNLNLKFFKRIWLPVDRQITLCRERFDPVCVGLHIVNLSRTTVGDKEKITTENVHLDAKSYALLELHP